MHTLLIMAGLGDSSEGHWQTMVKAISKRSKVIQNNWNQPELED
jgi:predicted alpha/beta hydrolase family esterase